MLRRRLFRSDQHILHNHLRKCQTCSEPRTLDAQQADHGCLPISFIRIVRAYHEVLERCSWGSEFRAYPDVIRLEAPGRDTRQVPRNCGVHRTRAILIGGKMRLPHVLIAYRDVGGRQPIDVRSKAHVALHIEGEVRAKRMKGCAFCSGCVVRWINKVLDAPHAWSTVRCVSTASIVKRNVLRRWENLV